MSFTIAIIGRPNVGKSTLFNRLVGQKLALVDDEPGVTRDRREGEGRLGDLEFTVIDTAGLDEGAKGSLTARMQEQTEAAIGLADALMFVVDARAGLTPNDRAFADFARRANKPVVLVANKSEGRHGDAGAMETYALGLGEPIQISAEHGEGLSDLYDALRALMPEPAEEPEEFDDDDVIEPDDELSKRPIRVAIVGRPNAGKSTLINRLLGEERLLTSAEAGTTRDSISVEVNWQGRDFRVFDTAGLRRRSRIEQKLEKLSVADALRAIRFAEVVVLMMDAQNKFEEQDLRIADLIEREGRALVIAANKWDLMGRQSSLIAALRTDADHLLPQVKGMPIVAVSGLMGEGVDRLMSAIEQAYAIWNRIAAANADRLGNSIAVECGAARITHEVLADRVLRLSAGLTAMEIGRGGCVVVLLPSSIDHIVSFLGVVGAGAGAVLVDPNSKEYELHRVFADCRPVAVITDQAGAGRCRRVADQLGLATAVVSIHVTPSSATPLESLLLKTGDPAAMSAGPDDDALHQYSSGSTGRAKRVVRTHGQCVAEGRLVAASLEITPDDTILCALPLFHAYGFGDCFLTALASGARLLIQPNPQPFVVRRRKTLDLIETERVTVFPAVPYMVELLADAPGAASLASLRYCFTAGTALSESVAAAFARRFGVPARQLYGCTEVPSIAANRDPDPEASAGTVGTPFEEVTIAICGEDGLEQPAGETGEVGIRSPAASSGYVGESYGDRTTFREDWVFPGDVGVLDAEGRLALVGRTKLFIEVHGQKVDPIEVEDVLGLHPAVGEAVVVGSIDPRRGTPVSRQPSSHACPARSES